MTLSQRQLAALASLDESGAAAYAVPLMLELDGPLDADRLAEAVAEVCRRHDSLWASIDPLAGRLTFADPGNLRPEIRRSEEHTSELQSLMRISYAVFCLKKKKIQLLTRERHE